MRLEVTGRRERCIQPHIQDACFLMLKTLDALSFEAQPEVSGDAGRQVFVCGLVADAATGRCTCASAGC